MVGWGGEGERFDSANKERDGAVMHEWQSQKKKLSIGFIYVKLLGKTNYIYGGVEVPQILAQLPVVSTMHTWVV
jgi:hypothetical protein